MNEHSSNRPINRDVGTSNHRRPQPALAAPPLVADTHPPVENRTYAPETQAAERTSPLLSALGGNRPARTPVWFMRQAGRSLPEYREARKGTDMLEACVTPDLTAELTLQPVRRYGVDAAIFFSDIVTPMYLAHLGVRIEPGRGPVFDEPLRTSADVDRITKVRDFDASVIVAAARKVRAELPPEVALIGFAGAPFTLASYLVEGAASKNHLAARALMKADPQSWHKLAGWCAALSAQFLAAQIEGGAQAVQLFDSWAGDLSAADYREHCLPHSSFVLDSAHAHEVPTIHFGVGTVTLLRLMHAAGADCIGVDWRLSLEEAVTLVSPGSENRVIVQGNLDPAVLFCPEDTVKAQVKQVLQAGKLARSHIFNLGHGVPPNVDPDVLQLVVDTVHAG